MLLHRYATRGRQSTRYNDLWYVQIYLFLFYISNRPIMQTGNNQINSFQLKNIIRENRGKKWHWQDIQIKKYNKQLKHKIELI